MTEFEGAEVSHMEAVVPRTTVDADVAFQKDTHLDLKVGARVRQVRFDDHRDGGIKRVHVLEIETIEVLQMSGTIEADGSETAELVTMADPPGGGQVIPIHAFGSNQVRDAVTGQVIGQLDEEDGS